jgi:hypothetical protein
MPTKLRVHAHVSPTLLRVAQPEGDISGRLFIEVDGTYFPGYGWVDLVLPVLSWWIESSMRLFAPGMEVDHTFMDGPYVFSLRRDPGSDNIALFMREGRRVTPQQYTASYARWLASLRGAAKSVINELAVLGFPETGEVSTLKSRLTHIMRLEAEIKAHGLL